MQCSFFAEFIKFIGQCNGSLCKGFPSSVSLCSVKILRLMQRFLVCKIYLYSVKFLCAFQCISMSCEVSLSSVDFCAF